MEKQRTKTEYKNDDLTIASKYVQKKNSLYRSLLFYVKILEHHLLQINTKNAATFCVIIKFRYLIICFVLSYYVLFSVRFVNLVTFVHLPRHSLWNLFMSIIYVVVVLMMMMTWYKKKSVFDISTTFVLNCSCFLSSCYRIIFNIFEEFGAAES